ncbi:MAG: hypothetical protein MI976_24505 [Pseudomonadales bacterium]|nr:hypothetical protein [Pseudomonadales bacterium]
MKKVYIIGDKFKKFLEHENTISISNFEKQLFRNRLPNDDVVYYLGQGVASDRANKIAKEAPSLRELGVHIGFEELTKSARHLVHKHNAANSMISVPRRVSELNYQADVHIDDRCADLDDHITGQHVSGMALVEICRQMFLAVTEQFYLKAYEKEFYFVIKSSSIEYKRFVFPLEIRADYKVLCHKTLKPGVFLFKVDVEVIQDEKVCAISHYEFISYIADQIEVKEDNAAIELLQSVCESVREYEHGI